MASCAATLQRALGEATHEAMSSLCGELAGGLTLDSGLVGQLKWVSSLAMLGPRPLRPMARTRPQPPRMPEKGQAISRERLCQQIMSDPSHYGDSRSDKVRLVIQSYCLQGKDIDPLPSEAGDQLIYWWYSQKSGRSTDFSHKSKKEVLLIQSWSHLPWVGAELATVIHGRAQSGDDSSVNVKRGALGRQNNGMAGSNQAQLSVGHQIGGEGSTTTSIPAFEWGSIERVNQNSSGSCGDVRTLCKTGRPKEALHVLQQRGVGVDSSTYVLLLQQCINMKDLAEGTDVHAHIVQSGFKSNSVLLNTLVNMYAKCGSMVDACKVFNKMTQRDLFTWTTMITGYAKSGCSTEAFKVYEKMRQEGLLPNKVTYISVIKACASLGALEKGKVIHADIIKTGIPSYINLENCLIDMYAKCGSMNDAREVFDSMAQRDVVSWNTMITGYSQHGFCGEAFKIYEQMQQNRMAPNRVTFICLLNTCARLESLDKGKEVHADIVKAGIASYINLENTLVDMYAKCGSLKAARQVFDNMAKRDVVSWSAMIAGYAQHEFGREALDIYEQMQWEGVKPSKVTFICVLNACTSLRAVEKGEQVHTDIIKAEIVSCLNLQNSLVNMYAKCGSMKNSCHVFDNMAKRDVVSWNALIAGYAQHGYGREAFHIYDRMELEGVTPDRVTFTCILKACAGLRALEKGKRVHADIIRAGIATDIILETALVDMYANCQSMKCAWQMFDRIAKRDVVSWCVMITGYAHQGCGLEAFRIYEQMQCEGMTPDRVTFTCILNVCASLRDLGKGKRVHADISKSGIVPDIILENTLVDMYAKCGSMKDAHQVFDNMAQRDVVSWNAMIAGYAQHEGRQAFKMYEKMQKEVVMPDRVTFMSVLNACATTGALEKGKEVHTVIIKCGISSYMDLETALVGMYARCGSLKDARQVFDSMDQHDVVSWNALITVCAQHGCGRETLQLFEQMQHEGLKPNRITFISLLSACSHAGLLDEGQHYFDSMSKDHGVTPAVEHLGCMVDLFGRAGRLDDAEDFINQRPIQPDVGVWRALLGACRIHGNVEVAECAAKRIMKNG